MWNKQCALSLLGVAGLLAGVGWVILRPHEPFFQGKPLSFWFRQAAQNGDLWQENSKPTAELAVRSLGSNAVPLLVEMASTKFAGWRILWRATFGASLVQMALDPQCSFLHLPVLPADQKQQIAFWGFKLLGPQASSAVPALARLLQDEDSQVRQDAAICLSELGPAARPAVPALAATLTANQDVARPEAAARQLAAFALGQIGSPSAIPQLCRATNDPAPIVGLAAEWALMKIRNESPLPFIERLKDTSNPTNWHEVNWLVQNLGSNAQPAIPLFLAAMNNADKRIQNHAIAALGNLRLQPEICVPAIIPFLHSTNTGLRQTALWSLGAYGTNAAPALAEIVRCLKDSDSWARQQATNALRLLNPTASELRSPTITSAE